MTKSRADLDPNHLQRLLADDSSRKIVLSIARQMVIIVSYCSIKSNSVIIGRAYYG